MRLIWSRYTDDGLDSTVEERLQRRLSGAQGDQAGAGAAGVSEYGGTPILGDGQGGSFTSGSFTGGQGAGGGGADADLIHRKSLMDMAEDAADAAADEAREEEGFEHVEEQATLAGLIQDFGLRLFFLGGVRFALALVFLAANGSLIMVLINRFDYTVEVALGFALVFDLGIAMIALCVSCPLSSHLFTSLPPSLPDFR